MKDQFDVWRFRFPDKGEHPAIVGSQLSAFKFQPLD